MNGCPVIPSWKENLELVKSIPDELRKYQLPGTVSVLAKGPVTSVLLHHFRGDGFGIRYSNYLGNQPGVTDNKCNSEWKVPDDYDDMRGIAYLSFTEAKLEFPGGLDYDTFDIYFSREIVQPYAACCPKLADFLEDGGNNQPSNLLHLIRFISPSMMRIIRAMLDYKFHKELAVNYFTALIHELLTLVATQVTAIGDSPGLSASELNKARKAREIIISDFEEYHSVEELARKVGTSEVKLQCAFKHLFGTTVFKFSREARLQKGLELLSQTDYPLRVICMMVGYDDPGNFSVAFRNHFGYTPGTIQKLKRSY